LFFLISPELNPQAHLMGRVKMIVVNDRTFIRTDDQRLSADFIEGVDFHK